MKKKSLTIFTIGFICFMMLLPSFALAASSKYSFTMNYRVVDGSANGIYHSLSKGKAYIEGMQRVASKDKGHVPKPYTVNYTLYNKTSGNKFGNVAKTPPDSGSNAVAGSYSGLGGGTKYYLLIWKTEDDGFNITGDGSVYN